jgi:hypothetical protein
MRKFAVVGIVFSLLISLAGTAGCSSLAHKDGDHNVHAVVLVAEDTLPQAVKLAPKTVRDAYRFAATNEDVLSQIPCYCGCGGMNHTSNYNCFWDDQGNFDNHALGCGICVDIAQDTLAMLQEGVPLARIRAQIDADYGRFGPATDTPPVALAQP